MRGLRRALPAPNSSLASDVGHIRSESNPQVVSGNPLTGIRRPFLQITPADPSGVWGIQFLKITPSGRAYAYCIVRKLSDLYLIEGLK